MNILLQVLTGVVIVGTLGKITTLTELLAPQDPVPAVPAMVVPQSAASTYLAVTLWHPGVVVDGDALYAPPSMLYSILNPVTGVTVGNVNAALHVFEVAVITGAVGKITTLTLLLSPHDPVPAVPARVAPQSAAKTYLAVTL